MSTKLYPSPLLRYLAAVILVLLGLVLRLLLVPVIGDRSPFLIFIAPITIAAWYGGIGPGLISTLLSLVAIDYFFVPPVHSLFAYTLGVEVRMVIFALEGTVVSSVIGALRNAIYRTKAELALQQTEEQLKLLIESIEDYAIIMLDPDGNVVTWNNGAEQLLGYRGSEIIGSHVSTLYTQEDAALAEPEGTLRHASASLSWRGEQWRLRKDGTRFRARVIINALRDRFGSLRGFAEIIRETTWEELDAAEIHSEEQAS